MSSESLVRQAFSDQAKWCAKIGSPFTARLLNGLGRRIDRSTLTGRTILDWDGPPDALGDAVPLRLAGALHAFVRRCNADEPSGPRAGDAAALAALAQLYPPRPLPDPDVLAETAMAAIADADAGIAAWLDNPPQTNEAARSGILYPGLMEVAKAVDMPLSLFEVGASAGLNLIPDRYAYRLGGRVCGLSRSPVHLSPDWSGRPPAGTEPQIVSRRGCDSNPLDVTDSSHCERLAAYVWPDQPDRLTRVEAAIAQAREDPPQIDNADAADWVDAIVCAGAREGTARVLFHSIAFQYFATGTQQRIEASMREAGAQASAESPLAWLAFEQIKGNGPTLTLRLWPGGGERMLARAANAHVRGVHWMA